MTDPLLGIAEIAAMLGVSRQRVDQLVQSPDFPAPEAELSAGRIWSRRGVEAWLATHPRRAAAAEHGFAAYSDAARAVVVRAQEEARRLRHPYIGTEHLLLALLDGVAPDVERELGAIGIDHAGVTESVTARFPPKGDALVGHIPFTPRSQEILAPPPEADAQVEPRHLAVRLAAMTDGAAAAVMRERSGLDPDALLAELERRFDTAGDLGLVARALDDAELLRCSFCGKGADEVTKLVAGPAVYICDVCVGLCDDVIAGSLAEDRAAAGDAAPPTRSAAAAPLDRDAVAACLDAVVDQLAELRRLLGAA